MNLNHNYTRIESIISSIYVAAKSNLFERQTGIPGFAVAFVAPDKSGKEMTFYLTRPVNRSHIDELVEAMSRKHPKFSFRTRILTNIHGYCEKFGQTKAGRDPVSQGIYDAIADKKEELFGNSGPVYQDVKLLQAGDTVTEVDFVTEDKLIQIDLKKPDKTKRSKSRVKKNNTLRKAREYFKPRYGELTAARLDIIPNGSETELVLRDIVKEENIWYRNL